MSRALALLLAGLALPAAARAGCPPGEPLLAAVRAAERVQFEQLGGDETRVETPLAHVPGRTLGHEVYGIFRASAAVAALLREAFARRDSYACTEKAPRASFRAPEGLPIGLYFSGPRGAVALVLRLPEGEVEIQREGDPLTRVPLSRSGQNRWEAALALLARETRTGPQEFYEQMLPPDRVPPGQAEPADTTGAPGGEDVAPGRRAPREADERPGPEASRNAAAPHGVTARASADRVRPE